MIWISCSGVETIYHLSSSIFNHTRFATSIRFDHNNFDWTKYTSRCWSIFSKAIERKNWFYIFLLSYFINVSGGMFCVHFTICHNIWWVKLIWIKLFSIHLFSINNFSIHLNNLSINSYFLTFKGERFSLNKIFNFCTSFASSINQSISQFKPQVVQLQFFTSFFFCRIFKRRNNFTK